MQGSFLYSLISNYDIAQVPSSWKGVDFAVFSDKKKIYAYQKEALENACKILFAFFENYATKDPNSLKRDFLRLAIQHGLSTEQKNKYFAYSHQESKAYDILATYYSEEHEVLPAYHFINRMSFWMATGSGKSIVLIKLIEMLHDLMHNELIPQNDILFLSHRPDLIAQLKSHIAEFNEYTKRERGIELIIKDIREFPEQKRQGNLFKDSQVVIYYYTSHNFTDKQKDNQIDFKNYENGGQWYVILDEAHKGDSEESKRKQYFNILSRNGFLFNFSATFTDEIDRLSTVYNLNLAAYIQKGFGKHLYVLQEQFKHFQTHEVVNGRKVVVDYVEEEKQKIVLMSLILLTYIKQKKANICKDISAYHNPLLLTLVNSVSAEDSDLYLFFKELRKIAKKEVDAALYQKALKALSQEFYDNNWVAFEQETVLDNIDAIQTITIDDILREVFNTNSSGELEVRRNPKNHQELSFSVKSGANSLPFALIKIGDIKAFEKNNLSGYAIEEHFEDLSLFEHLDNSSINILMGSRSFYEGWDSNRPNIINFVNIGVGKDASKFVLQSLGRGIRIEPIKNHRKRLLHLINDGVELAGQLTKQVAEVKAIETLFVLGTNQQAILAVLDTLKGTQPEEEHSLNLFDKQVHSQVLYIPTYKVASELSKTRRVKFNIHRDDFAVFEDLMTTMDKMAFALHFHIAYKDVLLLASKYEQESRHFLKTDNGKIGKMPILIKQMVNYYTVIPEDWDSFAVLEEEIAHYKHIKVTTSPKGSETSIEFKRLEELKSKIQKVQKGIDKAAEKEKLKVKYKDDIDTLLQKYDELSAVSSTDTPSELSFLNGLEKAVKEKGLFAEFDTWLFSKIDHSIDKQIKIPYIDPKSGKRDFLPDFVFWLQKGNDYHILYIDPKGTARNEYEHKVDGYRRLFEEHEQAKTFSFQGKNIRVHLRLATNDLNIFAEKNYYQKYWIDIHNLQINLS